MKNIFLLFLLFCQGIAFSQAYRLTYTQSGFVHDGCNLNSTYFLEIGVKETGEYTTLESALCGRANPSSNSIVIINSNKLNSLRFRTQNYVSSEYNIIYRNGSSCAGSTDLILTTASAENVTISFSLEPYFGLNPNSTPVNNLISSCDKIKIEAPTGYDTNLYKWEYAIGSGIWKSIVAFDGKNILEVGINDLENVQLQTNINFRLRSFCFSSRVLTYVFIACSPSLINTSNPNYTTCNYTNGSVEFTFSRALDITNGERFLFNRKLIGTTIVTSVYSDDTSVNKISDTVYRWENIPSGNYEFNFQTQFNNNTPSSVAATTEFTINKTLPLFFTVTPINPLCHDSNIAGVTITAMGGTPPYFYILDGGLPIEFTSPSELELSIVDHTIKVIDSNNCIEKTP